MWFIFGKHHTTWLIELKDDTYYEEISLHKAKSTTFKWATVYVQEPFNPLTHG